MKKQKLSLSVLNKRARRLGLKVYKGKGKCRYTIKWGKENFACSKSLRGVNTILHRRHKLLIESEGTRY